jgi:mono/diheme cytochrome c family protein
MKYFICLLLVFSFAGGKIYAQKKLDFNYPADSVNESSRKAFEKNIKDGKALYIISCAVCHNIKEGRKEIIPDFSLPQLMDYELRIGYPEHQDRLKDTKITDEEMNKIVLFLRFKKNSGISVQGSSGRQVTN